MSVNGVQGDSCETFAAFYYASRGHVVSKPLTRSPYYDLIVDIDGQLFRVECKSSRHKSPSGSYSVSLVTSGGNQSWNKEVKRIDSLRTDIVFAMDADGNYFEFLSEELIGKKCTALNPKLPQYRGTIHD
jgi:hypothetical protein